MGTLAEYVKSQQERIAREYSDKLCAVCRAKATEIANAFLDAGEEEPKLVQAAILFLCQLHYEELKAAGYDFTVVLAHCAKAKERKKSNV